MMTSHSEKQKLTNEQAIACAQKFIELRACDYPLVPVDEDGETDWEAYEPGCTNWNILEEFSILRAELAPIIQDDDTITVEVEAEFLWSESEGEKENCVYHVYVERDTDPNLEELHRGSFDYDVTG